jgi:protein PhnA
LVKYCLPGIRSKIRRNEDQIEGRTDKVKGLVLRTEFLKKA